MNPSASVSHAEAANPVLDELIAEITDKLQAGETVDVEAYAASHPELAEELRRLIPTLQILAVAGSEPGGDGAKGEQGEQPLSGILGDFRILREVGRGGMGIVYEAEQVSLGRRVALKVLPFAATMDQRHLQRFHNEARAASSLEQAHIVPVYSVGCERGVHYYAMKFIDGLTVAALIAQPEARAAVDEPGPQPQEGGGSNHEESGVGPDYRQRTPPSRPDTLPMAAAWTERASRDAGFRQIAQWGIQAAEALEHAHSVGIVHRDIKPANLMLDGQGLLWVTDFGLARTAADAGLTMTGDLLGTLRYMSPEQALAKHGLVDHRTDIYALGATLYELLTGRPAVTGRDREEILNTIMLHEPPAPRTLQPAVPRDLQKVVLKALAKDPSDRYATAKDLADDLRRWLEHRPVEARPPSSVQRLWKWTRRRPALAALLAVSVLALAGSFAGIIWHNRRLETALADVAFQRDSANEQRARAETNYRFAEEQRRQAGQAVDDMYTQVAEEWFAYRPRLQPLQRRFLEKALRYYQQIVEQRGTLPDVEVGTAEVYHRLGRMHVHLGHLREGVEALREAARRWEKLAAPPAAPATHRYKLCRILLDLGGAYQATGTLAEAERAYRAALTGLQELVKEFPTQTEYAYRLASTRGQLGHVLGQRGLVAPARAEFEAALADLRRLTAGPSAPTDYRSTLAETAVNLGNLLGRTGRVADAEAPEREANAVLEKLVQDEPWVLVYRERLGSSLANLGGVLMETGRLQEARRALERAAELIEDLKAYYPEVPDYRWELAGIQGNLAFLMKKLGRRDEEERWFRRALQTRQSMVERFPDVAAYQDDLATDQIGLAELLGETKRFKEAEGFFGKGLQLRKKLVATSPDRPEYEFELARDYSVLAHMLETADRPVDAQAALQQELAHLEALFARHPAEHSYRLQLALTCAKIARSLVAPSRPAPADIQRAMTLARRALQVESQPATYWLTLGLAYYRAEDWPASEAALRTAMEHGKGGDAREWFLLAMSLARQSRTAEARPWYDKAVTWMDAHRSQDAWLRRVRAEAAALLGQMPAPGTTGSGTAKGVPRRP